MTTETATMVAGGETEGQGNPHTSLRDRTIEILRLTGSQTETGATVTPTWSYTHPLDGRTYWGMFEQALPPRGIMLHLRTAKQDGAAALSKAGEPTTTIRIGAVCTSGDEQTIGTAEVIGGGDLLPLEPSDPTFRLVRAVIETVAFKENTEERRVSLLADRGSAAFTDPAASL